jgi:hypothetical protein
MFDIVGKEGVQHSLVANFTRGWKTMILGTTYINGIVWKEGWV